MNAGKILIHTHTPKKKKSKIKFEKKKYVKSFIINSHCIAASFLIYLHLLDFWFNYIVFLWVYVL